MTSTYYRTIDLPPPSYQPVQAAEDQACILPVSSLPVADINVHTDRFEQVSPSRVASAALAGFVAGGVAGIPLGYVNGFIANVVVNGSRAFFDGVGDYTPLGTQTQSNCLVATVGASLVGVPVAAVFETLLKTDAKPYKQSLFRTLLQFYPTAAGAALAGAGVGSLVGLSLQTAVGTEAQWGYDAARVGGAVIGGAASLLAVHEDWLFCNTH